MSRARARSGTKGSEGAINKAKGKRRRARERPLRSFICCCVHSLLLRSPARYRRRSIATLSPATPSRLAYRHQPPHTAPSYLPDLLLLSTCPVALLPLRDCARSGSISVGHSLDASRLSCVSLPPPLPPPPQAASTIPRQLSVSVPCQPTALVPSGSISPLVSLALVLFLLLAKGHNDGRQQPDIAAPGGGRLGGRARDAAPHLRLQVQGQRQHHGLHGASRGHHVA